MLYLLILIISLVAQFFLPWWSIAVVAFGLAFWKGTSGGSSFRMGWAAIFTLWLVAAYISHYSTMGLMSDKIAQLLKLSNPYLLIFVTAFVGGLVGGFSALSGYLCRNLIR